jgi:phospholipase/lecithinase/hemolysin
MALFSELYAVGDSLSDSGGIFQLSSLALALAKAADIGTQGLQPIPVSPPYAQKFSNGPVLPEITADLLDATLYNFSFGGAQALGKLPFGLIAEPVIPDEVQAAIEALPPELRGPIEAVLGYDISLSSQVAALVAATSVQKPSPDSALVSLIGLNDLRGLLDLYNPANPGALIGPAQALAGKIVAAQVEAASIAFHQGIGTVIFETLPAASFFPIANQLPPELQAIGDAAVDAINQGLEAGALLLSQQGHVRIVDLARMADEISADPGTFGFLSLDEPTLLGNGIEFVDNPFAPPVEQTAFFDFLHPTTNLHGEFALFTVESLASHTDFRGAGNDVITGTSGDDLVLAGAGNDQAALGGGNDVLLGGLGNDIADGGQGSDLMAGGAGNDQLSGGPGSDVLAGNAGDDTLNGGPDNDALIDGLGSDTLSGGPGNDLFLFTQAQLLGGSGTDIDQFNGGVGFDTLALLLDPATLAVEQAHVAATFVAGRPFAFSSMDLTIAGIEQIVLTTEFGFDDVPMPDGDALGARLHEADLFGFV